MSLSKSYCLISTIIFSPSKLKLNPLIAENTAIIMVKMMNLTAPSVRSPDDLIVSTIWPLSRGKRTKPPEDTINDILAMSSICLFFQVYPNSRLKVLRASFAFRFEFWSELSWSKRVDLVRPSLYFFSSLS